MVHYFSLGDRDVAVDSIHKFTKIRVVIAGYVLKQVSSCECSPRCDNNVFEATTSSSQLSDQLIDSILASDQGADIKDRHDNANEISSRVATNLATNILQESSQLIYLLRRLETLLSADVVKRETSLAGQLFDSIATLVDQTTAAVDAFTQQVFDHWAKFT